eukprot:1146150-Pelagomonas_calceolata.AAC.4
MVSCPPLNYRRTTMPMRSFNVIDGFPWARRSLFRCVWMLSQVRMGAWSGADGCGGRRSGAHRLTCCAS